MTGKTLAEFSRERLFEPLGMNHTQWRDNFRRVVPNRAVAYSRAAGAYEQDMPFEDVYGHGGLLATVASAAPSASFAGTFYNELNGAKVSLVYRNGTLALSNGPTLRPLGANAFALKTGTFTFAGADNFIAHSAGTEAASYRRLNDAVSDRAALAADAGQYRNDEVMATYRVIPNSAGLEFRIVDKPDYVFQLAPLGPDTFGGSEIVVRSKRDPT